VVDESGTVVKPELDEHGQSETLTWIITQIPAQKPARGHAINNSTAIQIMAKIAFLAMMKEELSKYFRPLFYDSSFRGPSPSGSSFMLAVLAHLNSPKFMYVIMSVYFRPDTTSLVPPGSHPKTRRLCLSCLVSCPDGPLCLGTKF
jgi:hypothetical protein